MIGHVYAVFRKISIEEMKMSGTIVDREMLYPTFETKVAACIHLEKVEDENPGSTFYVDVIYRGR